ncbi:UNVERIFIED_CONTAM: hypothetical protein GTU68_022485 [Idotea baltica]|nr:hypothetical protein [Idotea baltica]
MADTQVFPNPQVGAVIVHEGKIIGEGFHALAGGPHAEVAAIQSVKATELLPYSTMYVSLEPCCFQGKTPPCVDAIVHHKIPHVVIGCLDPNPKVAGKGIARLKAQGINVEIAADPTPFAELNKAFFVNHQEKRPFVTLKWAESVDGFIGGFTSNGAKKGVRITHHEANSFVHLLRSTHHSIMVGRMTALADNPKLSTRLYPGKSPKRIIFDRSSSLPRDLKLFTDKSETIVLSDSQHSPNGNLSFFQPNQWTGMGELAKELYLELGICSILVEGGTNLLQQFIDQEVYDEIFRFQGDNLIKSGTKAPQLPADFVFDKMTSLGSDKLFQLRKN